MSATRLRNLFILAVLGCLAPTGEAQTPVTEGPEAAQEVATPAEPGPESELRSYLEKYLAAFNEGDARAVAALWTEDAVWRSDVAGSATTGREAIEASLAEVFAAKPGLKLSTQIERTHVITDGVFSLDGTTTTSSADEEPSVSAFTAVVKKTDEGWRLCDVHEYAPPVALTPRDKLQELAFLVGEWQDESEAASVSTTVRWGAGESFLVRSYVVSGDDGEPVLQGTQVIGWDPRAEKFRSWSFDSEGGFGEGVWSRAGDECVGRLTETLADGSLASATQVIRQLDADTLEVTTVGREVAGEPQPSTEPVRVSRVVVAEDEEVAGGEQ
jgi:uncharacterized protein (TIGR02246 family)